MKIWAEPLSDATIESVLQKEVFFKTASLQSIKRNCVQNPCKIPMKKLDLTTVI